MLISETFMKRSKSVPAALVASFAALFVVGCSSRSRDCVDASGRVIPDAECNYNSGRHSYPHWVYRSRGSGGFFGGTRSTSGGGASMGTTGSTSRGGFGSGSGSSFGG